MRPTRTWQRASLLVALSLAMASAAMSATSLQPVQPEHSNPVIIQGPLGPVIFLNNPGHGTWLGLTLRDTNSAETNRLKLPQAAGPIVVSVVPGSPAAKAGFQQNDIILQFGGQRVRSAAQLHRLIKETPAGRTVKVEILRQGKFKTLQAKIEDRGPSALLKMPPHPDGRWIWRWPAYKVPLQQQPGPFPEAPRKVMPSLPNYPKYYLGPLPNPNLHPPEPEPFTKPGPQGKNRPFGKQHSARENALGISGQNLTPQLARYFGVKEGYGVLVTEVKKGSPASAAGLKAGDVIVGLGPQQISSMAELRWLLQTQPNRRRRVTLEIVRNREERQMSVQLNPERPAPNQNVVRPLPIMSMRTQ